MLSASMSTMRACGSNPPLRPSAYFSVLALTIPCRTPTEPRLPIPRGLPSSLPSTRRRSLPFSSMTNRGRRSRNPGSMYVSHRSSGSRMWPSASITLYARAIGHPSEGNEDRRHILLRRRRRRTENVAAGRPRDTVFGDGMTARAIRLTDSGGSRSSQPVERGRVVASQLTLHLRRQVPHLSLDRRSRVRPDAVGMRIVRGPQEVSLTEERDERHRHVVVLERRVDLPLEEIARLRDEGRTALVGPELLGLPESPVAVVELLNEPGQPAGAGLGHHHAQLRVPLENAPGEEVDERLEEVREEELGVLEDARGLAHGTIAGLPDEHRDMPREDHPALLEHVPERLPCQVVDLGVDVGDHQIDLAHAALRDDALELGDGGLGRLRKHRQADEPIRRRLAEIEQPVVVDAVAGRAQDGVVRRDLEGGPKITWVSTPSRSMSARRSSGTAGRRALWS